MLAVDGEALWYLTRGTGLVSLLLLTIVVVLGVAQVRRWAPPGWPQFVAGLLHRNASLFAVAFVGVHIAAAVLDGFAPIDWIAAVVPFQSPYRSVWLGLGALAFDLVLALIVTSLLRRHLSYRTWSLVHWTAYLCWPLAFVHGLGTGSDGTTTWSLLVNASCLVAVLAAITWRLLGARRSSIGLRVLAGATGAVVTVAIGAWAVTGPTQPGWARRAGTPEALLPAPAAADPTSPLPGAGSGGPSNSPPTTAPTPADGPTGFAAPFTASFSGTVEQSDTGDDGRARVTIAGTVSGGAVGELRIVLDGQTADSGGIEMQSSVVTAGPPGQPDLLRGSVSSLRGDNIRATVQDGAGNVVVLSIRLSIDRSAGLATGAVAASAAATGGAVGAH